jgi:hypothetical protein
MNDKYDLIVAGGGFAGVAAALSASREGLDVLLFDKNNCLGGAAAGCLVNPFMPYWTTTENKEQLFLSRGIFSEITQKIKETNVLIGNMTFNEEYLKLILNRLLIDAGVTLLYNSYLIDADTEDEQVKSITVANKSGKQTYYAKYFIDATGDGDLSVLCGCPYHLGRESDNLCQPMTLCFRVANVDSEKFEEERNDIQNLYKEYRKQGKIKNLREDILTFITPIKGVIHFNSTRIVKKNPVDAIDVTAAEIEAREQVFELLNFLRENFESFKNSELIMTAAEIGVRESRMIEGEYVLTQEDLISCKRFEDSIAVGNYDIDIHNPEGSGTSHYYFKPGEYYTIPYRCLTPKNVNNLLVAGRCISSTHEAQASYRIMPICCCLGQAAGTAAAIANKDGIGVKDINITKLQQKLKECGVML